MLYIRGAISCAFIVVLHTHTHTHLISPLIGRVNPVTWAGQEVLLLPVGQEVEVPGLFVGLYSSSDDPSLEEEEEEEEGEENTVL